MCFFKCWFYLSIFLILLNCSGCSQKTATTTSTGTTGTSSLILSGTLTYDFISASTGNLNYAGKTQKPMRKVYVELLNASTNVVLGTNSTNELGGYSFTLTSSATVKLRIYAEMKSPPVIIQDNTNSSAEYVLVSANINVTGATTFNVNASSGWTGSNTTGSYTSTRISAPFAMLDSIYTITKKINADRPSIVFPLLKLNWSINNVAVSGTYSSGNIGTSHYNSSTKQLYVLGKFDADTDEFDNHVIVHEWGHFFEDNLSRSDSAGGSHGSGDEKDISLAFGEGWGNALSAMAFDPDYNYVDTFGSKQQTGFIMNMESGTDPNKGWFSESSIQQILYDIYDTTNETGDSLNIGIGAIIDVLTNYEKTTPAATSLFTFIYGLKINIPSASTDLNTLLANKNISSITSPYGTGETHDGGWVKNLPIYNSITLGGVAAPFSLYGDFGGSDYYGLDNTIFNNKYLNFTATSSVTRLVVTSTNTFGLDVYYKGSLVNSQSSKRLSAASFGPFTYNISTISGNTYSVNVWTDQAEVYTFISPLPPSPIVDLTITGSAH